MNKCFDRENSGTPYVLTYFSNSISVKLELLVIFVCLDVMYSCENDICDVTLRLYPHQAS